MMLSISTIYGVEWQGYWSIGKDSVASCYALYLSLRLSSPLDLGRFFSFLILYTISRISLDRGSARRKAATYTQNKRTQTSIPWVGFEPTTPAFEQAKTIHALDRAATVIGGHALTEVLSLHLLLGTEENHEEAQDGRCSGLDSNWTPPECRSSALPPH
jgi:hypothetical protein